MYAVISTGGKQYRVAEGQRIEVERVAPEGSDLELKPLLIVDGDHVLARPADLAGASVAARVVAVGRGRKIRGFTYKAKTRQRRRWGHRQATSTIEITSIKRS